MDGGKKIGIDARLWNETGVGRYIRNLVRGLGEIDGKNEYVLFGKEKDKESIKDDMSKLKYGKNWKIAGANIRWHTLKEQIMFPSIIEKEKLDLMHFPYFSVPIRYKGRYVLTIHDLINHHFPTGRASTMPYSLYLLKHEAYRFVISRAAKRAEKIFVPTDATKKDVIKTLGVSDLKIVVTPEGVDKEIISIKDPESNPSSLAKITSNLGLSVTDFFLYVGNAYPHKNLATLVEAFLEVRKTQKNVNLIFVGKEDHFYKQLRKRYKKRDSLIFLHNVTDEELSALYKKAIALVIPSFMEGFGLPGLEAMVSNCLVVASNIPVFHEVYQDAAVFFYPQSV
jgi:glycosyltransferase involved in cell wall biosynthesis